MKKYRLSSLLVTFVLALTLLAPFSALAADAPHITSRHAVLMDANYGEILYEKAAREKAYPASITKVMTALLVSEAIDRGELSQDQMITVSSTSQFDLSADGSTANLKPGEVISVKDLMYCLLLPSANEAANILAEAVCGDVASFIELMNQRAGLHRHPFRQYPWPARRRPLHHRLRHLPVHPRGSEARPDPGGGGHLGLHRPRHQPV